MQSEMRRLRDLEDENNRLKRIAANLTLDREMLQDVLNWRVLRPVRKRRLVNGGCSDWRVSIRKACGALRFDRSTYHYKSCRTDPAALKKRIKGICAPRVSYALPDRRLLSNAEKVYRRVHFVLQREGWNVNINKMYRIYNEMGLELRNKTPKPLVIAKQRNDRIEAVGLNDMWTMRCPIGDCRQSWLGVLPVISSLRADNCAC